MTTKTTAKKDVGSAFSLLGKSVEVVKRNWQAFVVVNIITILSAVAALFSDPNNRDESKWLNTNGNFSFTGFELSAVLGLSFALVIVLAVLAVFLYAMMTVLEVRAAAGGQPTISELARDTSKCWLRLIGLMIVSLLIVAIGLLLLIVPGIIAIGRIIMAPYFMVDKNLGIMESLKQSNQMGKAHTGKVWGMIGVAFLIGVVGSLIGEIPNIGPILGTLVFIAYSMVPALRYQQLKGLKA